MLTTCLIGRTWGEPKEFLRSYLVEWFEDGRLELFNLREDIGEKRDLAEAEPEKASALHRKLKDWRAEVGARMPEPYPGR